jgi:hypothetical protein
VGVPFTNIELPFGIKQLSKRMSDAFDASFKQAVLPLVSHRQKIFRYGQGFQIRGIIAYQEPAELIWIMLLSIGLQLLQPCL